MIFSAIAVVISLRSSYLRVMHLRLRVFHAQVMMLLNWYQRRDLDCQVQGGTKQILKPARRKISLVTKTALVIRLNDSGAY